MRHHFPRVHWQAFDHYNNVNLFWIWAKSVCITLLIIIPIIFLLNYLNGNFKRIN